IFISGRVYEDIHNQPGLSAVRLGDFSLKNVESPVPVYAVSGEQLVVPDEDYLLEKGKIEEKQQLHLPPELTSFVGREEEQRTLSQLLSEKRLVTLTGPGGIGKSRLVARVAERVTGHFPNGVYFVALAPISDPGLVPDTIARTLGITVNPQKPTIESLKEHLKEKKLLLILDNFEQITPAAWMISELLANCPDVKVLVTSRIPLNIQGEQEFAVLPLQVPEGAKSVNEVAVDQYPSIELFVERAKAVKPNFSLKSENLTDVASICAGLDGLPLAIELAAARIKILPPKAILNRLSQRLDLLKGGPADKPPRHQTLRQSIAWSYDLLSAEEQSFFQTLSIFVGGADLEAIEAVYEQPSTLKEDPFDLLASLINHSLVRTEETKTGDSRFYMLETIREFGLEKLQQSERYEVVEAAHTNYFLELAERAEPELKGANIEWWLEKLENDYDNLRAVLDRAEERRDTAIGLRIGVAIWRFWITRGRFREGARRLERFLQLSEHEAPSALRAKALQGMASLVHVKSDYQQAQPFIEESLDIWRRLNEKGELARVLNIHGWVLSQLGYLKDSAKASKEALEIGRELNDLREISVSHNNLGWLAMYEGNFKEGQKQLEKALSLREKLGNNRDIAYVKGPLAQMESRLGNYLKADQLVREAMKALQKVNDPNLIAWVHYNKATNEYEQGHYNIATEAFRQSLSGFKNIGNKGGIIWNLMALTSIYIALNDYEKAKEYLFEQERINRKVYSVILIGKAQLQQGQIAVGEGLPTLAIRHIRESIANYRDLGNQFGLLECFEALAYLAIDQEDFNTGVLLLSASQGLREALKTPLPPRSREQYKKQMELAREGLGGTTFDQTWKKGLQLSLEATIRLAEDWKIQ
ncbi:MAG: AAA family ATPase, partial [Saprospiraceae bacterium]|nr:AAA family ATPase [Saprospiraceae bacterium]